MAPSNTNLWESSNFCLSLFPTTKIKPWTLMAGGGVHIHRSKVVGPTRQKMIQSCVNGSQVIPASALSAPLLSTPRTCNEQKPRIVRGFAAKSDGFSLNSILKGCQKCGGKGAIECPGCKGTGKNKKNGNIFERWKCFDCQGFGLKSCPSCGKGGLTPEQRGER